MCRRKGAIKSPASEPKDSLQAASCQGHSAAITEMMECWCGVIGVELQKQHARFGCCRQAQGCGSRGRGVLQAEEGQAAGRLCVLPLLLQAVLPHCSQGAALDMLGTLCRDSAQGPAWAVEHPQVCLSA